MMILEELFKETELPVGFYFLKSSREVFGTPKEEPNNIDELKEIKSQWKPYFRKANIDTNNFQMLPAKKAPSRIIRIR